MLKNILVAAAFLILTTAAVYASVEQVYEYRLRDQGTKVTFDRKPLESERWLTILHLQDMQTGIQHDLSTKMGGNSSFGTLRVARNGGFELKITKADTLLTLMNMEIASLKGKTQSLTLNGSRINESPQGFVTHDLTAQKDSFVGKGRYQVNGTLSIQDALEMGDGVKVHFKDLKTQGTIKTDAENLAIKLFNDFNLQTVQAKNIALTLQGAYDWTNLQQTNFITEELKINGKTFANLAEFFKVDEDSDDRSGISTQPMSEESDDETVEDFQESNEAEKSKFIEPNQKYQSLVSDFPDLDNHAQLVLDKILGLDELDLYSNGNLEGDQLVNREKLFRVIQQKMPQQKKAIWLAMALEATTISEAADILEDADGLEDPRFDDIRLLVIRANQAGLNDSMVEQLHQVFGGKPDASKKALNFLAQNKTIKVQTVEDFKTILKFVSVFNNNVPTEIISVIKNNQQNLFQLLKTATPFMQKFPNSFLFKRLADIFQNNTQYDFNAALAELDGVSEAQALKIVRIYDTRLSAEKRTEAIAKIKSLPQRRSNTLEVGVTGTGTMIQQTIATGIWGIKLKPHQQTATDITLLSEQARKVTSQETKEMIANQLDEIADRIKEMIESSNVYGLNSMQVEQLPQQLKDIKEIKEMMGMGKKTERFF